MDSFVLDLKTDPHAWPALQAYAEACARDKPDLYDLLNDLIAARGLRRCLGAPFVRGQVRSARCHALAVIPLGSGPWVCVKHAKMYGGLLCERGKASLARREARADETSAR